MESTTYEQIQKEKKLYPQEAVVVLKDGTRLLIRFKEKTELGVDIWEQAL